jgi:hypothetical protein
MSNKKCSIFAVVDPKGSVTKTSSAKKLPARKRSNSMSKNSSARGYPKIPKGHDDESQLGGVHTKREVNSDVASIVDPLPNLVTNKSSTSPLQSKTFLYGGSKAKSSRNISPSVSVGNGIVSELTREVHDMQTSPPPASPEPDKTESPDVPDSNNF